MSILMKYIWKSELPQELRAVLVSLMMNAHIDAKPRTERNSPMYIKKLILELKSPGKSPEIPRVSHEKYMPMKNLNEPGKEVSKPGQKSDRFHDVVVDITKIKAFTKTLQSKVGSKGISSKPMSDNAESGEIELEKMTGSKELHGINYEIIEEFIKEDDSIKEEEMKELKEKIIEFLENDIYVKQVAQPKHKSVLLQKEKDIIFNDLLLNIVQLVRKLIIFECFSPYQISNKDVKGKPAFFASKKNQTQTDFFIIVKHLLGILEHDMKITEKRKKTQTQTKKSFANQLLGAVGDVTETMKNFTTGLGQIFFTPGSNKEQLPSKRKKRESIVNTSKEGNFVFL